jgi:hypothetical protein
MKSVVLFCDELSDVRELVQALLKIFPDDLLYAVPHTSCRAKVDQINGVHAHFVSEEVSLICSLAYPSFHNKIYLLRHLKI